MKNPLFFYTDLLYFKIMMASYIRFADTLSTSMGKAFSWCIVILMGGTVYEVVMAYAFNKPTLWNFDFSMQMYGAILMMSGAYCLATEAHVRGDVIYRSVSYTHLTLPTIYSV